MSQISVSEYTRLSLLTTSFDTTLLARRVIDNVGLNDMIKTMFLPLVTGLLAGVASTPHCSAMCGPLAAFAGQERRSVAAYAGMRCVSYATTGALAGAFGELAMAWLRAPVAQALLSFSLAAGLALTAHRLWKGVAPQAVKLRVKPSRGAVKRAALIGLLTGILPCGALAAALFLAAGSGGTLSGSLTMLGFALGSTPALASIGMLSQFVRSLGTNARRVLSIAFALGAIVLVLRPMDSLRGEPETCHTP